jgi:hypothetical protein
MNSVLLLIAFVFFLSLSGYMIGIISNANYPRQKEVSKSSDTITAFILIVIAGVMFSMLIKGMLVTQ